MFVHVQMTGLIARINLRWHPNLSYVNMVMSIVNFDVDFFGPQCLLTKWDSVAVYFVQLSVPFLIAIGLCIQWLAYELVRQKRQQDLEEGGTETRLIDRQMLNRKVFRLITYRSDRMRTYVKTRTLQFVNLMYHTLAFRCCSVFVCKTEPNGETSFMTFSPDVTCGTTTHNVMIVVSVVYMICIIFGYPFYVTRVTLRAAHDGRLADPEFVEVFAFLFAKYNLKYCWWEVMVYIRRLALVFIVVFVGIPMLQGALAIALISVEMTLQLITNPMTNRRVDILETFCMCCTMAYAVSLSQASDLFLRSLQICIVVWRDFGVMDVSCPIVSPKDSCDFQIIKILVRFQGS